MQNLIEIIDEQIIVEFSGRIFVKEISSSKNLGEIVLIDGELISVHYQKMEGLKALFEIYLDTLKDSFIHFDVQPEIIESSNKNIHHPFKVVVTKLSQMMTEYAECKKLRPPLTVKLVIKPEFIELGEEISDQEFNLLTVISDFNKVEDIYQHSNLMEFEVTKALVSLRKKGALKVVQ